MKRIFTITFLSLVLAAPVSAQLIRDQVGGAAIDTFTFESTGGQYKITLTWLGPCQRL